MTLHEAMVEVLRERGGWMYRDELAREIAERDLYRQRDGGPAPSDQLRLRARKYDHLFEGSDPTYTRIRLRSGAVAQRRPPRRRSRTASTTTHSRPPAAAAQPRNAEAARRRRARAARKFRPDIVKLLLVAEAPPSALDRYFYFEDVREQDALFRYVARGLLGVEPTRENKGDLLGRLRDEGVFLIDVSADPLSDTPLSELVPDLVRRVKALAPEKVILIKATVHDSAFQALRGAGLPVVDERSRFRAPVSRSASRWPSGARSQPDGGAVVSFAPCPSS